MKNLPFNPNGLHVMSIRSNGHPLLRHSHGDGQVIRGDGEFSYDYGGNALDRAGTIKNTQEGLVKARNLFEQLEKGYHIKTAGFRPVVGHYRDTDVGAVIAQDYIDGESHKNGQELNLEQKAAACNLLGKLTQYLLDSHTAQSEFLSDIGSLEQYVYEPDQKEYVLVDMDPYFSSGYVAEGTMSSNMSVWAKDVLAKEEYEQWHTHLVEAIKPEGMAA